MNRAEAEDYVYESYMTASKEWEYGAKDEKKRNPFFSKSVIEKLNRKPAVHVTGSKGKGSVANMISQILSVSVKTGMMTSPHLIDFTERFRINQTPITDEEFAACAQKAKELFADVQSSLKKGECISPIGIQCVIALLFFNDHETDINIFEGGKGVKYDDVNNILHDYSVINPVFLEHTRELGNSIEEIAEDKAETITGHEKCVFLAEQKESAEKIFLQRAERLHVPVKKYGRDFYAKRIQYTKQGMKFDVVVGEKEYRDLCIPLLGEHQAKNCALALAVCSELMDIDPVWEKIKEALSLLKWPGRMEILSVSPFILLDACINRESAYHVRHIMRELKIEDAVCIIGIPDDKDYAGVAAVMSECSAHIILTRSSNPYYVFTDMQKSVVEKECSGRKLTVTHDIMSAGKLAIKEEKPILILGTTSLIADVKRMGLAPLWGQVWKTEPEVTS